MYQVGTRFIVKDEEDPNEWIAGMVVSIQEDEYVILTEQDRRGCRVWDLGEIRQRFNMAVYDIELP